MISNADQGDKTKKESEQDTVTPESLSQTQIKYDESIADIPDKENKADKNGSRVNFTQQVAFNSEYYAQKNKLENDATAKHVNFGGFVDADKDLRNKLELIDTSANGALEKARRKLQVLLEDEMDDHTEVRLEVLFQNLEDALRGDDMLIPEDILEYATYLMSENNNLRKKAFDLWHERLKQNVNVSKFGELRRPCNGDLLIDAFCDLIINHDNSNETTKLIELLAITGRLTSLRHGFTRLLAMYTWAITDTASYVLFCFVLLLFCFCYCCC